MNWLNKKGLKDLAETFENFRKVEKHLQLVKDLKKYPDKHGYLYCYTCGNQECEHIYDLGEFHPNDYLFGICGKCFKNYYYYKPEQITDISKHTLSERFRILERDNFKCVYCGRSPNRDNDVELQIDHVFPKSKGGTDVPGNLVTSCKECNSGKRDYILKSLRG